MSVSEVTAELRTRVAASRFARLGPVAVGMASWVPGLLPLLRGRGATRGSDSARYCYSVWLRHLVRAAENGLPSEPATVAELGPGDSLGAGLAALLCGASHYVALDVIRYAPNERNLRILDDLVALFEARAAIPGEDEFPNVKPKLASYAFPTEILSEQRLGRALAPERVAAIRGALRGEPKRHGIELEYSAPWFRDVRAASLDWVFSQACLEHVDDLPGTYEAMARWLRPGGVVSHQIDFKSHHITAEWDGHRRYSDAGWWLVRGRRENLINRAPLSIHEALLERHFALRCRDVVRRPPETPRAALAPRFRELTERDREASGLFVQGTLRAR